MKISYSAREAAQQWPSCFRYKNKELSSVLGSPSLIVRTVSVDVKQHLKKKKKKKKKKTKKKKGEEEEEEEETKKRSVTV